MYICSMKNNFVENGLPSTVIFCLARGYKLFEKYRYAKLILRNLLIKKAAKKDPRRFDVLIFHEGNITRIDQFAIRIFSGNKSIKFIKVSDFFEDGSLSVKSYKNDKTQGYTMMCRFHYGKAWNYLESYEQIIRIDDDCFVSKIPILKEKEIFMCCGISEETHTETNSSLFEYLTEKNLEKYYDHKFPYTNLYITKSNFWKNDSVVNFLKEVLSNPKSIENRWGDMPIIGVTLKTFGKWDYKTSILEDFNYEHFSHRAKVAEGLITYNGVKSYLIIIRNFLKLF